MAGQVERRVGGVLLPPGVGLPPFPSWIRTWEGEGVEEKKEGGCRPPLLVLFGLGGGARGPALAASPLFYLGPLRPIMFPGGSGNLPVFR